MLTHATWRKSSYSNGNGGMCVEVAFGASGAGVRDSKDPSGVKLHFEASAWRAFTAQVR
jgi:hypothetical protein